MTLQTTTCRAGSIVREPADLIEAFMSEHAWVLENIETFNAGGLEPDERERLQQHVGECSSCAQTLEEASTVDQVMENLFAEARPEAALEDRMIQFLRIGRP